MDQKSKAEAFRALHKGPDILVLPNGWDAASVALMADAGARAVATSSAAVAWAHGYPDGDVLPFAIAVQAIAEMARALPVPLTADIEGGYTDDLGELADNISRVIEAGAVGVNLEDGSRDPDLHARKVEAARKAADKTGVPLFINARVDVYLRGLAEGEAAFVESVRRAGLYQAAGADGIFVPGPNEDELVGRLAGAIALPLNLMGRAGLSKAKRLQALGVRRVSSGARPFRAAYSALNRAMIAFLAEGDADALAKLDVDLGDLNKRFA
ncbi:MAG: isocitrate lyase/phosphoenolpyruvate mutase family protein [Phenylobacterium sp.]